MQSSANCSVSNTIICNGSRNFSLPFICQYCFQLPENETYCDVYTGCSSNRNQYYISNCTASPQILCLGKTFESLHISFTLMYSLILKQTKGNRQFQKLVKCNFVGTKSWSTAFWLSILLGGFAADRFYLGYIGWGIFKLLSFGGLGLWTLIDAILIAVGHLGPADGSLYV